MMSHLNEEQLILHYYGEESETLSAEQHLEECGECRTMYASLVRVLNVVDSLPVPDRGEGYGEQVWSRIEKRIPGRRRFGWCPAARAGLCCGRAAPPGVTMTTVTFLRSQPR